MKRKRPTYKKFKAVPHKSTDGSEFNRLESHEEVHAGSGGRIGRHTTYRQRLATSSPPRDEMEAISQADAPPSISSEAALDFGTSASSNPMRPANVRGFQLFL